MSVLLKKLCSTKIDMKISQDNRMAATTGYSTPGGRQLNRKVAIEATCVSIVVICVQLPLEQVERWPKVLGAFDSELNGDTFEGIAVDCWAEPPAVG